MAVATLVPLDEYLSTSYEPDREYVDGQLIERNVGELKHGFLELMLGMALNAHGLLTFVEARFQIRQNRFRIPDVMALLPSQKPDKGYQRNAPYIVIEVLSPDDRIDDLNEKLDDYFDSQVPNTWVVDSKKRTLTVHWQAGSRTVRDRVQTHDGLFVIDIADIFRKMDDRGVE